MNCCHRHDAAAHPGAVAAVCGETDHSAIRQIPPAVSSSINLIGVVVDAESAGAIGQENQVLVEFTTNSLAKKRVLAELARGLSAVTGDRVLFVLPANSLVAVVTSILAPAISEANDKTSLTVAHVCSAEALRQELVLQDSESLCVKTSSGQTLIAIESGARGPIVRLGEGALELDMPGELHLMADSLRFTTRSGPVSIQSQTDDVVVQGRTIRLN